MTRRTVSGGRVGVVPSTIPLSCLTRGSTLPVVSSLWTPEGEHPVDGDRRRSLAAGDDLPDDLGDELTAEDEQALALRLEELRSQLVATPAEVVIANHAYGLFELAAIHLSQQPPHLDQARLAVDALGALIEGLAGRLGETEPSLRDALAQIRLAYVEIGGTIGGGGVEAGTAGVEAGGADV